MEAESVIWTDKAKLQLEEIYLFIGGQSLIQADKVFDKIVGSTKTLLHHPYVILRTLISY
jgi:plasmid stabilization system protein ParE